MIDYLVAGVGRGGGPNTPWQAELNQSQDQKGTFGGKRRKGVRRYIPRQEMQFRENVKCRRGPRTGDWTRYSFVELVIQKKSVVGCRGREKKFKISKFKISLWRCDWLRSVPKVSASYHSLQDQDEDQGRGSRGDEPAPELFRCPWLFAVALRLLGLSTASGTAPVWAQLLGGKFDTNPLH